MDPAIYLQYFSANKTLYAACMEPVCRNYDLSHTELDILMFLANNPQYDTAAEICEFRMLAKSHVSTSLRALEEAGFLEKYQLPDDKRLIHLRLLPGADAPVADGRAAQEQFRDVVCAELTQEELDNLEHILEKILNNATKFIEETRS